MLFVCLFVIVTIFPPSSTIVCTTGNASTWYVLHMRRHGEYVRSLAVHTCLVVRTSTQRCVFFLITSTSIYYEYVSEVMMVMVSEWLQ